MARAAPVMMFTSSSRRPSKKSSRMTGKVTALNRDKYHILRQRNWRCDIEPARRELGYQPQVQLKEGVHKTIQWYLENKWL